MNQRAPCPWARAFFAFYAPFLRFEQVFFAEDVAYVLMPSLRACLTVFFCFSFHIGSVMHRNQSVNVHQFSMVPRSDIPRSRFTMQSSHKTTFDAGNLIPIYVDEVLPGDTFKLNMTGFARMATPIFPIMDNLHMDTFFFFVPYRLNLS